MNDLLEELTDQAETIGRLRQKIEDNESRWEQTQLELARLQQENLKLIKEGEK